VNAREHVHERPVNVDEFDYDLPAELIAQAPAETRDASRLLVLRRATGEVEDRAFTDLPGLLRAGDCLVVNDSRVIPARVLAEDDAGRPVELLFVEPLSERAWRALVRPGRRCKPGAHLRAGGVRLRVLGADPDGTRVIAREQGSIDALLDAHGLPPLPPYIARYAKPAPEDWERYQTVYAAAPGSVAARTLESAADERGGVRPFDGVAELTLRPGHRFGVVDALLTNFHLPRSSLLLLVAAFAGREAVLRAYRHAVDTRYRFYSYGDAMFIE